ncbi:MAG TPA: hypothetical protein VKB96_03510 [Gammaproteobacteria bacterium]|nr:hypothetical protein [Gammaproteobacteria bacterium]
MATTTEVRQSEVAYSGTGERLDECPRVILRITVGARKARRIAKQCNCRTVEPRDLFANRIGSNANRPQ